MAKQQPRNLNNIKYWQQRSEARVSKHWQDINNVESELARQYRIALDDIRQMVSDLFTKYAKDNAISYTEATRQLTKSEIGDYKAKLAKLLPQLKKSNDPKVMAEYNKLQKVVKLNRFQALMGQIEGRLLSLGHDIQTNMEDWLSGLYKSNYYQTIFDVQVGTGIGVAFNKLNPNLIKKAITTAWSGEQWSKRIWDNRDALVKVLRNTLTQGFIKGQSVQDMARNLKDKMNSGYANALRLVRTESAYVIGESTAEGYKESRVVYQYIFVATLDGRTSTICREHDNKVYKLADRKVGVNASPMHPNCRSTEAPYFNGENIGTRIARGGDGKTYKVPANMSYSEWEKQYVNN